MPLKASKGAKAEARFWSKVEKTDGCWLWRGGLFRTGYGCFYEVPRPGRLAHRYAYELLVGPVPEGLELDHLCRVRHCVNPAHLEPITHAENMARGIHATKTHCKHGHEFTEANTLLRNGGKGRTCRACAADRIARFKVRQA